MRGPSPERSRRWRAARGPDSAGERLLSLIIIGTPPPPGDPPHTRRSRLALKAVSAVVVAAVLAGVAVAAGRVRPGGVSAQHDTDDPVIGPDERAAWRRAATATHDEPVILSYHDVGEPSGPTDRSTVRPQELAGQLAMLDEAGFSAVGAGELIAHLDGAPLPPRPVVITFDGAGRGVWSHADRMLERHGFRAIMLVSPAEVDGTSHHLHWPELARLHDGGRWDIGSHTGPGPGRVPLDGTSGRVGHGLLNRRWLPSAGRSETIEQWEQRVGEDLAASADALVDHGLPRPRLLSYATTPAAPDTNDERIPGRLDQLARTRFAATLVDVAGAGRLRSRDLARRQLPRIRVSAGTTRADLFERLTTDRPLDVMATRRPLDQPGRWHGREGDEVVARFGGDSLRLDVTPRRRARLAFAPADTGGWSDYTVSVAVSGLSRQGDGSRAFIEVLVGSDLPLRISVTGGWARIERVRTAAALLERARLPLAEDHRIEVILRPNRVVIRVDGALVGNLAVPAPELGPLSGGLALGAERPSPGTARPWFRDLTVTPNGP